MGSLGGTTSNEDMVDEYRLSLCSRAIHGLYFGFAVGQRKPLHDLASATCTAGAAIATHDAVGTEINLSLGIYIGPAR